MLGHGIWVLTAWLFRQITGRESPRTLRESHSRSAIGDSVCPVCHLPLSTEASECSGCSWSPRPLPLGAIGPLQIAIRQLKELAARGLISEEAHREVLRSFREQQRQLDPRFGSGATPIVESERKRTEEPSPPGGIVTAELVPTERMSPPPGPTLTASTPPFSPSQTPVESSPVQPPARPDRSVEVSAAVRASTPAERARKYTASRQQAVAEPASPPAPPKHQPLGQLLSAFMEEKNIRWGELVGGLLIVSCSIALVVSFWSKIAERPFLKFGVFNGVTAALFGIGLHAAKRWKLPTTSQGLLITAMLLVPLNFLAIAAFSEGAAPASMIALAGEAISVVGFAALVFFAARTVVPDWPLALTAAVLGQCLVQLLIRRFVAAETHLATLYAIATTSLFGYVAVNAWTSREAAKDQVVSDSRANELFKVLGISTFATLLPAGLLLFKTGSVSENLRWLAPLAGLASLPALGSGLLLWRRADEELPALRTAGTSIAVAGVGILLAGFALSWPQPATMLPSAVLGFGILTLLALWFRIPEAHLAAGPCAALAYLLTCQLVTGRLSWFVTSSDEVLGELFSAFSGNALVGLVAAYGVGAWGYASAKRNTEATYHGLLAAAASAGSLALVTWRSFGIAGDPSGATWVYALYAFLAFIGARYARRALITWASGGLLLAALIQGVVFRYADAWQLEQPWTVALLLHATIVAIGVAIFGTNLPSNSGEVAGSDADKPGLRIDHKTLFVEPLSGWALLASMSGVLVILMRATISGVTPAADHTAWLAGVWLIVSWTNGWPGLFTAFQAAITIALGLAVDGQLRDREWYRAAPKGWLHPWSLQVQGVALATLSIGWLGVRTLLQRSGAQPQPTREANWNRKATRLLNPEWPSVDRFVTGAMVLLLALLATYAIVPGVAQELSPQRRVTSSTQTSVTAAVAGEAASPARQVPAAERFEIVGIPHAAAMDSGAWLLLAVLLVLLIAGLWEEYSFWQVSGVAVSLAAAFLLLAGRWESDVAVASALRWYTAAFFGLGSLVVWTRRPLLEMASSFGWPRPRAKARHLSRDVFVLLLVLSVAPLVAMAIFVAFAALNLSPATASQLQMLWWLGVVFLGTAVAVLVLKISQPNLVAGQTTSSFLSAKGLRQTSNVVLVLGTAPLLVMTLFVIASALMQHPILGPEPTSFFAGIGLSPSYALPLLVIAVSLVGHAIQQRSANLALAAGMLLNFCATAAYLLAVRGAALLTPEQWIRLAQLNVIVSAAYAIGWMIYVQRRRHAAARIDSGNPLITQVGMAVGFAILFILPTGLGLLVNPRTSVSLEMAAGLWGWTALALATVAAMWLRQVLSGEDSKTIFDFDLGIGSIQTGVCGALFVAVATLVACETHRWDIGNWLSYHTLLMSQLVAGYAMLGLGWLRIAIGRQGATAMDASDAPDRASITRWTSVFLTLAVLLSLRAVAGDPRLPWWSAAGLICGGVLSALLAVWANRRRFLYVAGSVLNLGASIWWIVEGHKLISSSGPAQLFEFLEFNTIVLALPAVVWLVVDQRWMMTRPRTNASGVMGFHRVASAVALFLLSVTVAFSLASDATGHPVGPSPALGWTALVATLIGVSACLWDRAAKLVVASLYLTGLIAVAMLVDQFDLPRHQLVYSGTMALAAYSVGTSYLWSRRTGLLNTARRLRIPATEHELAGLSWLVPANCILALTVVMLGYWVQLSLEDLSTRITASQAVIAQALAVGMLARGRRETELRSAALWLGVIGAVAFGLSWLFPETTGNLLNRTVVVATALAAMAVLYGLGLTKLLRRENEWTRAAAKLVPALLALALSAIAIVLVAEIVLYLTQGAAEMAWPAILAVAVTLVGLAGACLLAALVPGRDPLGLNERQRMVYVYAAEGMLALLFLHVRLTMPWLFSGFFERFWPLIVMLIAYLGVGLSEWFRRRKQAILAEPLERTGALLPMLPVFGFWAAPTDVHYSLLMLVAGLMYGGLSVMRRSFGFGILAALTVNGGLWYLLHETEGLGLLDHPQLWLIPPSLCVLAAAYLNRERLTETQLTGVRYLTSTMIYTASTADIFLNGVAEAPWLPFVLAGISILGILAGIMLRVRAFLFLGTSFLGLSLLTIIWYAAVDLQQTWLWFVSGIVAGIAIIAIFALFEKKRQEILHLVDELKKWEA